MTQLTSASVFQLWRYYQVGVINTLFGYGIYALLVSVGLNMYVAQIVGHLIGVAFNYFSYSRHVFQGALPSKLRFLLSYAVNYIVGLASLALAATIFSSPYVAGLLAMLITSIINFIVLRRYVFHPDPIRRERGDQRLSAQRWIMPPADSPHDQDGLIIYGLGSVGQAIVDDLLEEGVNIDFILDRGKRGESYRGIAVQALEDAADGRLEGRTVLIGLHNHYVDINRLHAELNAAGAARILSPINLPELIPNARTRPGYWLDPDFDYAEHQADFARVRDLLADETSRSLFDAILSYRRSGNIADCPSPSLEDEYTPIDLPRFATPLRIIDCGAFTGVAIHKFLKAGYEIESFVALEPDPDNFALLASRNFPVKRGLCLPLGSWSTTRQLRFASNGSMASHLSETGDTTIQCVAVDDLLHGEEVNLVKLDVEGAEIETLKGMQKIIHRQKPNLLVSAYHAPEHLYEIVDLIRSWDLGYRYYLRVHEYNSFGTVIYALQ